MVRAAIVGIGRWGKIIVESVQGKSDHITFVAGHTRTRTKAEDFCHEQNIDLHDDLDAILKDPTIDAVVFATPHLQHEEQVKRAAQAGKHIYVEKPFTLNVRSARAALDAVNQAGVVLGIDYHHRLSVAEAASFFQRMPAGTLDFLEEPIRDETPDHPKAVFQV